MAPGVNIDAAMTRNDTKYAWGSVVRCSLSGRRKNGSSGAGTGEVLPAFKHAEARQFLEGCATKYLARLPASTKVVCLLGIDNRYIKTMTGVLQRLYGVRYERVNSVAHRTGAVLWVHVTHPSLGNGCFNAYFKEGDSGGQGRKRLQAQSAVAEHLTTA
jgi:hypothetical protein